jgi:hypothetical protein
MAILALADIFHPPLSDAPSLAVDALVKATFAHFSQISSKRPTI